MMETECITSIIRFIKQTNFTESTLLKVYVRPIHGYIDENGKWVYNVCLLASDSSNNNKAQLSEAWIAVNILLFTVFDGYLENKYSLEEGASFKCHYNNIPENTFIDKISKNCYRLFKIIRNGIQHNLSNVTYLENCYIINYVNRSTTYKLQISTRGIRCLYTIVLSLIQNSIYEIGTEWTTIGHYEGIICELYNIMVGEIHELSDDIGQNNLTSITDVPRIRANVRYPIINPHIIEDNDDYIVFTHVENNGTDDINSIDYIYSTDYKYGKFLFPQELGEITKDKEKSFSERLETSIIKFHKQDCCRDRWKLC